MHLKLHSFLFFMGVFIFVFLVSCSQQEVAMEEVVIQEVTTPLGIEMVLIPSGEFSMGSEAGEADERPVHPVKVDSFYMDKYEVTQKAYEALMGKNTSKFKDPNQPVEQLGWLAAVQYCNMRSLREDLEPCYQFEPLQCDFQATGYRLPTEAEWEYACRAGSTTPYYYGIDPAKLSRYAWFKENSNKTTQAVGQKIPNAWGLHDMLGNVWEWCNDIYREDYYAQSQSVNPRGPLEGDMRVLRGGGWNSSAESCRCSTRYSEPPGLADTCFGYEAYGFRCVKRGNIEEQ